MQNGGDHACFANITLFRHQQKYNKNRVWPTDAIKNLKYLYNQNSNFFNQITSNHLFIF